jgi:hypothetical protein
LHPQQVANFNAVVQLLPVDGETSRLDGPPGPLLWRGLCQPAQPLDLVKRHADLAAIAERDVKHVARETDAGRPDLFRDPIG